MVDKFISDHQGTINSFQSFTACTSFSVFSQMKNRNSSTLLQNRPFYSCLLSDLAFEWQ